MAFRAHRPPGTKSLKAEFQRSRGSHSPLERRLSISIPDDSSSAPSVGIGATTNGGMTPDSACVVRINSSSRVVGGEAADLGRKDSRGKIVRTHSSGSMVDESSSAAGRRRRSSARWAKHWSCAPVGSDDYPDVRFEPTHPVRIVLDRPVISTEWISQFSSSRLPLCNLHL